MDDGNRSSNVFNIFLIGMFDTIQKCFIEQLNYNGTYKFNTSCTKEMQCDNTAMFCNLTTLRCQCAEFHFWNETVGICEFQHKRLTKWLKDNGTDSIKYITEIAEAPFVSRYNIPLSVTAVMILGCICFLFCAAYVCYGRNEVDGDKSLSAALFKQNQQSCKIQTSIIDNF
ncbi:uncharacterized protein LOC111034113 [Myzus persicae]|uniref:uncharacterized protein LOC111034113 n=1 Tax=Myzus persicae TaxID=13164 RepID=UPI000B9352F5|nr:uncharacterized protein LOC111034113 [Myzus persicae]